MIITTIITARRKMAAEKRGQIKVFGRIITIFIVIIML